MTISRYVDRLEKRIQDLESVGNILAGVCANSRHPHLNLWNLRYCTNFISQRSSVKSRTFGHSPQKQTAESISGNDVVGLADVRPLETVKNVTRNGKVSHVGTSQTLDAMGNVGHLSDNVPLGTYKCSSTASFMRQLRDAVDEKVRTPQPMGEDGRASDSFPDTFETLKPKYCNSSVTQHCILPPRHLADTMLDYYWLQGQALYPFLSKTAFFGIL